MLLKPFKIIKQQLSAIDGIKLITWYNNQIADGILHTAPIILIEFPDELHPETLNRQYQQSGLITRIHLIHKLHTDKDGSINDKIMQGHEDVATSIFDRLHEFSFEENNAEVLSTMERTAYRIVMDNPGWAITTQDFECLFYQPVISTPYHSIIKPGPDIVPG